MSFFFVSSDAGICDASWVDSPSSNSEISADLRNEKMTKKFGKSVKKFQNQE